MALVLTSGPAVEPVSLAEAKAHLRVDAADEDALITSLIVTARLHIEAGLGLALITQSWTLSLDAWPGDGAVTLPLRPVAEVGSVRVTAAGGAVTTVPAESYIVDRASLPPRLLPAFAPLPRPGVAALGIAIDFTVGFGAAGAAVPAPIRQALLLLVAHWYENREPAAEDRHSAELPPALSPLLWPYRLVRL